MHQNRTRRNGLSQLRLVLGGLIVAACCLALGAAFWWQTAPEQQLALGANQGAKLKWLTAEPCQLPAQTCRAKLVDAAEQTVFSLELTTSVTEIKPLHQLPLALKLIGLSPAELKHLRVEADLQGRDMYMGFNRTEFAAQEIQPEKAVFTATPILSLCTDKKMVWRLTILLHQKNNTDAEATTYAAYFDFEVVNR